MKTLFSLIIVSFLALGSVYAQAAHQADNTFKTVPKRPPVNDDGPGDDDKPPFQIP